MDYLRALTNEVANEKYCLTPQPTRKKSYDTQSHTRLDSELKPIIELLKKNNQIGKKPLIFGICGGQCSGKSLISLYLKKYINDVTIISEKDFFSGKNIKTRKHSYNNDKGVLFDNPEQDSYSDDRKYRLIELNNYQCYDWDLLISCVNNLIDGNSVIVSSYDFENDVIEKDCKKLNPNPIIIIEGMFIFKHPTLRNMMDLRTFVETDNDIRLSRMVVQENKYLNNKGAAFKSFFILYEKYIKTCFEQDIEPSKKFANLILPNYSFNKELELTDNSSIDFLALNLKFLCDMKKDKN